MRGRTFLSLAAFARLAGEELRVRAAPGAADPPAVPGVSEPAAEAALLQARLDWFQSQLARRDEPGPQG